MKIENFIQNSPAALSVLAGLSLQQKIKKSLQEKGVQLNFLQALTLTAVYFEQPKAVMVTSLVNSTGLSKSNISQIVSHLESEGLIKRAADKNDSRIWLLTTTQKASPLVSQIVSYLDKAQEKIESSFTPAELQSFSKVTTVTQDSHESV